MQKCFKLKNERSPESSSIGWTHRFISIANLSAVTPLIKVSAYVCIFNKRLIKRMLLPFRECPMHRIQSMSWNDMLTSLFIKYLRRFTFLLLFHTQWSSVTEIFQQDHLTRLHPSSSLILKHHFMKEIFILQSYLVFQKPNPRNRIAQQTMHAFETIQSNLIFH